MSADSVNAVLRQDTQGADAWRERASVRAPAAGVRPGQEAHRAQPLKSEPSPGFALLLPGEGKRESQSRVWVCRSHLRDAVCFRGAALSRGHTSPSRANQTELKCGLYR